MTFCLTLSRPELLFHAFVQAFPFLPPNFIIETGLSLNSVAYITVVFFFFFDCLLIETAVL